MKTYTPEAARTRWCPFARIVSGGLAPDGKTAIVGREQTAHNRIDVAPGRTITPDATACLANGCMAWRWAPAAENLLGYCGLAGRPE